MRPKLILERFFSGSLVGWGIQQSRLGQLQTQFTIAAEGSWNSRTKTLNLRETYKFDDGHIDRLEWRIMKRSAGSYVGHETRIEGEAKGRQQGNQFNWMYTRRVPIKVGEETSYSFDDTFYLIDKDSLVARAAISKLFFEVANMSVFYQRI